MDLAEFIIVVEDAGNVDGIKELLANIYEVTGINILMDKDGREPDFETMSIYRLKEALNQKFDTDNFRAVKERIVSEFLMPEIADKLYECAKNECEQNPDTINLLKDGGWL